MGTPASPDGATPEPGNTNPQEPTHDWQKRYSDLKSYHDKQIQLKDLELQERGRILAEKEKAIEALKTVPVKLPSTPQEIEQFKQKYPALYNTIKTVAMEENISTKAQLEKAIKDNEVRTQELAAEKAKAELLELHPDAFTLKQDPEFVEWYNEQIPAIKALLESEFVRDVARGIEIYKKDKGIIRKTKTVREAEAKAAAMAIPTKSVVEVGQGGVRVWKASEVKAIPMSQYHKYEAEINRAVTEGRYDENS